MRLSDIDDNFKSQSVGQTDIEWHSISEAPFDLYGVFFSAKDGEYLRFLKEWAKLVRYIRYNCPKSR